MKREIKIKDMPTTTENQVLEVRLRYEMGGANYFSGTTSRRGYYLGVTPVTRSTSEGIGFRSYKMFSGIKALIKEAARFNQKELERIAADAALLDPQVEGLVTHVCIKENIVLATEAHQQ
jgi:hypothetical protein